MPDPKSPRSSDGVPAAHEPSYPRAVEDDHVTMSFNSLPHRVLQITASVLLPLPASQAFQLITHPNNEQIFRHLERCTHHEVQHDDGSGRVVVESEHLATWRIFAFHGHLRTRLLVQQDSNALTSTFKLIRSRFVPLRVFSGRWEARPQPPERWAQAHGGRPSPSGHCCELSLEQELQPEWWLPPPLGGLLRQLASRQLSGVFEDLQAEAERVNKGRPTLWGPPAGPEAAGSEEAAGKGTTAQAPAGPEAMAEATAA